MREIIQVKGGQCGNQIGAKLWFLIMKLFMISASEHSSLQLPPMTILIIWSFLLNLELLVV